VNYAARRSYRHANAERPHGYATAAALTGGFHWVLWVYGLTGLAAIPAAFVLIRRTRNADEMAAAQSPDVMVAATR
jgi:hypothetical protein